MTEIDDVILRSMKRFMHVTTMGLAFQDEVQGTEAVVGRPRRDISYETIRFLMLQTIDLRKYSRFLSLLLL